MRLLDSHLSGHPDDSTVPELIARCAAQCPQSVAVISGDRTITYSDLETRSAQIARHLRKSGVREGTPVGICVDRSVEMAVAVLAVLKAGGAYVPLDPSHPRDRLRYISRDAGLPMVLCTRQTDTSAWLSEIPVVLLDQAAGQIDRVSDATTDLVPCDPEHLAYILYTSGSTGKPKGVAVTHRSLANAVDYFQRSMEIGSGDTWLSVTTLSFDIAGLDLFVPLVSGARLVIATWDETIDAGRLIGLMRLSNATCMQATPSVWRLVAKHAGRERFPGLQMLSGGETLPPRLAEDLLRFGGRLWNAYGPTETTIYSLLHRVTEIADRIPIGKAISGTEVYLLDDQLRPVPEGEEGEIVIAGKGVARGYLGRSDLTARRFVENPWGSRSGDRMYRTGDLGRRLPDGNFEFIGRIDAQIKLDGHRIEPGEIEAFLMQRSEVAEAAVVKQSDHSGNGRLVAYLILRAGAASAPSEIRQWLKDRLPEYMVPGHFVVLEAMPRTSSGKTDRSRLQADISPLPTPVETGVTSESIDDTVLRIWKRQLGCGEVNVDDNFFDVGGSSMLAISIHEELQSCLKRSFPVVDMFEFPTVRSLSQRLGGMTGVPG